MKLLMIMLLALTSLSSLATEIATKRLPIYMDDETGQYRVYDLVLLQEGVLKVDYNEFLRSSDPYGVGNIVDSKSFEIIVNPILFSEILGIVEHLSNANIVVKTRELLCQPSLPNPHMFNSDLSIRRAYDSALNVFLGDIEVVLEADGCWVNKRIQFESKSDRKLAAYLEHFLTILALQE